MDSGDSPEQMVCNALKSATNPDVEIVRLAERQLIEWETEPGFFPALARISVSNIIEAGEQLETNVRWMAAVYLKNGLNKYWRRGTRIELPPDEKCQIRELLVGNIVTEPIPQIALQVAVLIARIARYDCPREWPELMPELLKTLQTAVDSNNDREQQRLLLVLHHVIKALASRRMMAEKRIFEDLCFNIYPYITDMWDNYTTLFFYQIKNNVSEAKNTLERAVLALCIIRKFTIYGFSKPYRSESCRRLLEKIFARLKQLLLLRHEMKQMNSDDDTMALVEKFILKMMKMLYEFQELHTSSFANFVPATLDFAFNHVFHDGAYLIFTENVINFSNFAIHCINLMKSIMGCDVYTPLNIKGEPEGPPIILSEFFTTERLSYICEKMLTYYFVLTQAELEHWNEDPECYALEDCDESWRYTLRSSIETFYSTCFSQYQVQMSTEVLKYIHKAQQIELTADSNLNIILQKDAIYNAAGLASFQFFHDVDFDSWFTNQLIAELSIETDNFRILRRRIVWMIAQWTPVKFSRKLRPLAYEACLHLLRTNEDMSIRLAATRTLSNLICDFEFEPEVFLAYLQSSFNALFVLLGEAKECDTKMSVLYVMSYLVDKMSDHIEPQAERLISYLPLLWKESEQYNMLRCAILSTLTQLVKAIRNIPDQMKPFLYNVIDLSTDIIQPYHVYLIEEGLNLCLAVVENSTQMTTELLDLCKHFLPILEISSENLRIVIVIIQAYVLLDCGLFLERYGKPFIDFCVRIFDDTRAEGIVMMLKVFENIVKAGGNTGLEIVRPALPHIFKSVYLNKEYPTLMGMYLTMVARVLLVNQDVFTAVLQELYLPHALETILDVWIEKVSLISELEKRKLFCLAFCSIFSNNSILLERFPAIMQNLSLVLADVMVDDEDEAGEAGEASSEQPATNPPKYYDSMVYVDENDIETNMYCILEDFDYKNYHYDRFRQLALQDPVHKVVLSQYIEYQLKTLQTQLGDDAYGRLMQTVCPNVLQKIGQYVKINYEINQ